MGLAGMSDSGPISPYQRLGGAEAVWELVQRFYAAFVQTALHMINR
jgi:truncated hemoglobin YjbI